MSLREIAIVADPDRTVRVAIAFNYLENIDEGRIMVGTLLGELANGKALLSSFYLELDETGEIISASIEEMDEDDMDEDDPYFPEKEGTLKRLKHWCDWKTSPKVKAALIEERMKKVEDGYEYYSDNLFLEDLVKLTWLREWPYDTKWVSDV